MSQASPVTLSICIPTFNRASLLAQTLDGLIAQATQDCEIVVSDNASTDHTAQIVSARMQRFGRLRYIKQSTHTEVDRNFNRAVEHAMGKYCWLMPDDDLLKPGAIDTVLESARRDVSVILVNTEFRDYTLSRIVQHGALSFQSDRIYEPWELDRLFMDARTLQDYAGSVVVERALWLSRNKAPYYGSGRIQVGVIYQERLPKKAIVIARPLINMRMGSQHAWWSKQFEMQINWPPLIGSLALSEEVKRACISAKPWAPRTLLFLRALGTYSYGEYRQNVRPRLRSSRERVMPTLIALLPVILVNSFYMAYFRLDRRPTQSNYSKQWMLELLREGRSHHLRRGHA